MTRRMKFLFSFSVTVALAVVGRQAQAALNWGQGFDDNTDGWIATSITSVPSGGGGASASIG